MAIDRAVSPDEVRGFASKLQQLSVTSPGDLVTANGASLLASLVNKSIRAQVESVGNGSGSEFVNTVTRNVATTVSNLMENVPQDAPGNAPLSKATVIIRIALETLMEATAVSFHTPFQVSSPNLALSCHCPSQSYSQLSVSDETSNDNHSSLTILSESNGEPSILAGVRVPPLMRSSPTSDPESQSDCGQASPVEIIAYRTPMLFRPSGEDLKPGSPAPEAIQSVVLSVKFRGHDHVDLLGNPVQLNFTHNDIGGTHRAMCSYWHKNTESWRQDGCRAISSGKNPGMTSCECDHLTNFALLFVRDDVITSDGHGNAGRALTIITFVGSALSIICLLATVVIILYFKKLRTKPFQQTALQLSLALILNTVLVLLVMQGRDENVLSAENDSLCTALAVVMHLSLLVVFGLMAAAAVHLYLIIVKTKHDQRTVRLVYALAYGTPFIIVVFPAGITRLDAYGSEKLCWLKDDSTFYTTVVTPLCGMLVFNCIMLTSIAKHLYHVRKNLSSQKQGREINLVTVVTSMSVVIGLAWISGVLLVIHNTVATQYIFTLLVSTQGCLMFAVHTARSPDVRQELLKSVHSSTASSALSTKRRRGSNGNGSSSTPTSFVLDHIRSLSLFSRRSSATLSQPTSSSV
ncbi:latrophilin-like protein LAT-2 [Sycon ciliatum]|uniref:latrophilin-like protein LAT-2 n=1 Tax=Sycon ciliatum TaxID=27933 RepID=UPI0031F613A7